MVENVGEQVEVLPLRVGLGRGRLNNRMGGQSNHSGP
jgi:hypothetical protein